MIQSFRGKGNEDIFNGRDTKAARAICPQHLWRRAARGLDQLDSAGTLDDLQIPPGNRLEALTGERTGQHSIRINDQFRLCFQWTVAGPEDVEIVDYHWKETAMIRVPTDREPTHPGEMLQEEFLKPMGLTQRVLAEGIHVPYQRVNEIVNRRRGISPSTALRLSRFFGTSPSFWMNLQMRWDLFHAHQEEKADLVSIRLVEAAHR